MAILEFQRFRSSEGEKKVAELMKKDGVSNNVAFSIDVVDQDAIEVAFIPDDPGIISKMLTQSFGGPDSLIRVEFPDTVLKDNRVMKVPILEHVVHFFPAASVTAQLKKSIEDDFARFDAINAKNPNRLFCETGWSIKFDHPDAAPGQVIAFIIIAGWNSMKFFEEHIQREDFKKALPIIMTWKVPVKLWHTRRVER